MDEQQRTAGTPESGPDLRVLGSVGDGCVPGAIRHREVGIPGQLSTDQAAGGSNPSQRADGPLRTCSGPNSCESPFTSAARSGTSLGWSPPRSIAVDALSSPRFAQFA
jgi:hypothetical protein